ncbi:MAG: Gfo/Idh/MocA family oxidoreductase [Deltaproteobacteria bacterium]|nr:Gfo/Idh/MocA family oxidoreductase [Deltaproteobacteria bacterium]
MKDLNVGLVGCGVISEAHLSAWSKTPGFKVTGVLDTNREQAEARARQFGIGRVFENLDQLVAECDVVDVCTPPASHAKIAEQALKGKRHIVMEKPMVTKVEDWKRMTKLLEGEQTRIAVIHNLKFSHAVRTAKKWVTEGRIGKLIRMQREFLTHESTDRMLVGDSHWSHKLPGGRWFETLPHELYLTHWFAGPLELSHVTTQCSPHAPPGAPADEVMVAMVGNDCISTFHFSANCRENRRMFTLQGTEGHIVVDLLSDFASLAITSDSKWRRAVGRSLMEAGQTLLRGATDRGRYGYQHLRGDSPHSRIIKSLALSLRGEGEEPTPLDEVDYVVNYSDRIGREIDRQVAEARAARG